MSTHAPLPTPHGLSVRGEMAQRMLQARAEALAEAVDFLRAANEPRAAALLDAAAFGPSQHPNKDD